MMGKVDEKLLLVSHDTIVDYQSVIPVLGLDDRHVPSVLAEVIICLLDDLGYTRKLLLEIGVLGVLASLLVSRPVLHLE